MTLTLKKVSAVVAIIAVSLLTASAVFLGNQRLARALDLNLNLEGLGHQIVCRVFNDLNQVGPPLPVFPSDCQNPPGATPQCADGIDNDSDGLIDAADPGCHTGGNPSNPYDPTLNNEFNLPQCSDGFDNDGDGRIDSADPACHSDGNASNAISYDAELDDESLSVPQCKDGVDNDADSFIDINDPNCHTDGNPANASSYDETRSESSSLPACINGIDDDGDGLIDWDALGGGDPGCSTPVDDSETDPDGGGNGGGATTTTGTLVVKKVFASGTTTPNLFSFTLNGAATTTFDVNGQNDLTVTAGTYTILEVATSTYTPSYDNCLDASVSAGTTTTCTITNALIGTTTTDVSLTKDVNITSPNPGDTIVFTLTVTNNGPNAGPHVVVVDLLPSGLSYVSDDATTTGSTYATTTGAWTIPMLANGSSTALHITASVGAGTGGQTITNTASVTSDFTDQNTGNNTTSRNITPIAPTTPSSGGSSSSGGGSSGGGRGGFSGPPAVVSVPILGWTGGTVLGVATSTPSTSCDAYLTGFMRMGRNNDPEQVRRLQRFLNSEMGSGLPITGFFGPLTDAAVRAFQSKYAGDILAPWGINQPTGYVYLTTRKKINEIYCMNTKQFPLTNAEQQTIEQTRFGAQPTSSGGTLPTQAEQQTPSSLSGTPSQGENGEGNTSTSPTSTSPAFGAATGTVGENGSNTRLIWIPLLLLALLGAGWYFWPRPPTVATVSGNAPPKIPAERVPPQNTT